MTALPFRTTLARRLDREIVYTPDGKVDHLASAKANLYSPTFGLVRAAATAPVDSYADAFLFTIAEAPFAVVDLAGKVKDLADAAFHVGAAATDKVVEWL